MELEAISSYVLKGWTLAGLPRAYRIHILY